MRAILKSGKIVTGRLAEILVSCHVATPVKEEKATETIVPEPIKKAVFEPKQPLKTVDKVKPKGRPKKAKK